MNTVNSKARIPPATGADAAETGGSASPTVPATVEVAYHDGPLGMSYFGSRWERGKAKTVSAADWAAMQARHDCAPHDFRVV